MLQIYIKILNYKPVEIKKSLFFRGKILIIFEKVAIVWRKVEKSHYSPNCRHYLWFSNLNPFMNGVSPPLFITRANTAGIGNGIYLDCARVWEEKSGLTGVFNSCWVFGDK